MLADPSQTSRRCCPDRRSSPPRTSVSCAKLKSDGAPIKVVAAGATYDPKRKATSRLVAARGKAITRARDFVGKTVAIDFPNTIADLGVKEWLEKNGVDPKDVKFTYIPFPPDARPARAGNRRRSVPP